MQQSQIEPQETSTATSTDSPMKAGKLKASPASKPTLTTTAPAQLKTMADHTETVQEPTLSCSEGDQFVNKLRVRMSLLDRMSDAELCRHLEKVLMASPNISRALRRLFSDYVSVHRTEKDTKGSRRTGFGIHALEPAFALSAGQDPHRCHSAGLRFRRHA